MNRLTLILLITTIVVVCSSAHKFHSGIRAKIIPYNTYSVLTFKSFEMSFKKGYKVN